MDNNEERIVALETKLAWLEDFVGKLQGIAVEHTDFIDRIKAENRALHDKLENLEDAVQDMPNIRPPHY
jgi:SlyX protein